MSVRMTQHQFHTTDPQGNSALFKDFLKTRKPSARGLAWLAVRLQRQASPADAPPLQVRSRRYERIDDAFAEDGLEEIFTSTSYRATDVALTIFLLIWFGMGNYWVYRIYLPNFQNHLYEPNNWCVASALHFLSILIVAVFGYCSHYCKC